MHGDSKPMHGPDSNVCIHRPTPLAEADTSDTRDGDTTTSPQFLDDVATGVQGWREWYARHPECPWSRGAPIPEQYQPQTSASPTDAHHDTTQPHTRKRARVQEPTASPDNAQPPDTDDQSCGPPPQRGAEGRGRDVVATMIRGGQVWFSRDGHLWHPSGTRQLQTPAYDSLQTLDLRAIAESRRLGRQGRRPAVIQRLSSKGPYLILPNRGMTPVAQVGFT